MPFYILMVVAFFMGVFGEFCCKSASLVSGTKMYLYQLGAFLAWGSGAYTWTMIYRQKSMSEMMAIYNPCQMVLLCSIAVFHFQEPFTWKLAVAYVLVGFLMWLLK